MGSQARPGGPPNEILKLQTLGSVFWRSGVPVARFWVQEADGTVETSSMRSDQLDLDLMCLLVAVCP